MNEGRENSRYDSIRILQISILLERENALMPGAFIADREEEANCGLNYRTARWKSLWLNINLRRRPIIWVDFFALGTWILRLRNRSVTTVETASTQSSLNQQIIFFTKSRRRAFYGLTSPFHVTASSVFLSVFVPFFRTWFFPAHAGYID